MPTILRGLFVSTRMERQPEIGEDLRADAVVAHVGSEAELEIGVDGVEAAVLQLVGAQLVEQPDAAALLRQVQHDAALLRRDLLAARGAAARRSRSAASRRRRR